MKAIAAVSACLLLLVSLCACAGTADPTTPPEIVYGEDLSDECSMIISEARFASAYYTSDGEVKLFDGPGGMFVYELSQGHDVIAYWVHDYETEAWLRAETAFFVHSKQIYTPMARGMVAVRDRAGADALATTYQGVVMDFAEAQAFFAEQTMAHDH